LGDIEIGIAGQASAIYGSGGRNDSALEERVKSLEAKIGARIPIPAGLSPFPFLVPVR